MVTAARFVRSLICFMATAAALCTRPAAGAAGAAPEKAADATPDCSPVLYDMNDCVDYLMPWSKVSVPGATCCKEVEKVVKVSPWCLCDVLRQSTAMEVQVDMARADKLPAACNISVPDLGECKGHLSRSPAPAPSEVETAADAPAVLSGAESPEGPAATTFRAPAPAPASSSAISLSWHRISLAISLTVVACFFFQAREDKDAPGRA